jgi:hypothetical protein
MECPTSALSFAEVFRTVRVPACQRWNILLESINHSTTGVRLLYLVGARCHYSHAASRDLLVILSVLLSHRV